MTHSPNQLDARALALQAAGQLRLEAVQLADADPAQRRARYRQIVQEADHRVPPAQKQVFYQTLREWIPAWVDTPSAPASVAVNGIDPDDLQGLLSRVVTLVGSNPDSARSTVDFLTRALGVAPREPVESEAPATGSAMPPETLDGLARLLGVKPDVLNPSVLMSILPALLRLVLDLDKVAWSVWASMSANSGVRREIELQPTLAMSAGGSTKLTPPQVRQVAEAVARLGSLTVGLVTQVEQAGVHAQDHFKQISPAEVDSAVRASGRGSLLGGQSGRCWDHFSGIFQEVHAEAPQQMHRAMTQSIKIRLGRST
jgi:hypothetical protein